jgi:3-oxoacyl-[acyl-carrier protein] reductase
LITGASSGIGRATALRYAASAYSIAVNYSKQSAAGEEVAELVGGKAYRADVSDADAVAQMVAAIERTQGPIEIAVANAGAYSEYLLADLDDDRWDSIVRTNLGGCYHIARSVVPHMRLRGSGSIVMVASELAFSGGVALGHYVASKAAILGLVRSLARELAPSIRVNAVAPGPVDTPFLPDRDRGEDALNLIPLRRNGRAEEIAEVVELLASSEWTTGAVWSINGGLVIQ